ncbi:MAG: hypothetical protein SH817_06020 [Leptospira sp.]|nr:hypothetical protein [Leptospira sp.]
MFDLDMQLKKSQLLNYEFSSEILKLKFQETILQKEDLGSEVNQLIMESNVMNQSIGHLHNKFTWREKAGEYLINTIHYLVFKPLIYLASENDYLFDLQKAFYLEKNQKCNLAIPIYRNLEINLRKSRGDDHAFVQLHLGYCEAILGNNENAIKNLSSLISEYTGSHFADSGQVMLNIILSNLKKEEKFNKNSLSDSELGKKYYDNALFAKAILQFNKLEKLTLDEKYMKARSFERVGRITEASNLYLDIVAEGDSEIAKKANRRLMLIGNFYDGGEEVKDIAKKNAEKLGDTVISEFVESSVSKQTTSLVLETLKKEEKLDTNQYSFHQEKVIVSDEQIKKVNTGLDQKRQTNEKMATTEPPILKNNSPKKQLAEEKNVKKSTNNECLQFRSHEGGIHKAEKVLVLDGKFVTTYLGKTLATPVSDFELLESCKINSPFTIATDKLGKVSVKTATIKDDQMFLETDAGIKIINVADVQSMIPDSILEKIRFIVVRRKDGNFHYCNNIEFIGNKEVRLNSRSGVSVTKNVLDLDYVQLGDNSINFVIIKKDKTLAKSIANLYIKDNLINFNNDLGDLQIISLEDVQKIESE